ncbi:MAG: class I SAM-dependent methyltransferase [Saprospiraceae bacterium]|nr:class I SAM-dependent methyltransferase [Saprospiraceae bacterium]
MSFIFIACADKKSETLSQIENSTSTKDTANLNEWEHEIRDRTVWQKPYDVIHKLGSLEGKVIADIGAGSGYFSFRFIHEAEKVIAIDIDPDLIQMMDQEKIYYKKEIQDRFEARLAEKDDPKLKDGEVDIIFIANTYTYIQNRKNYLKALLPKFKPGGQLMIVDFKKKLTPIGPAQNCRMAQSDIEQELLDAGYSILDSDDLMLEYQYIIVAKGGL